MGSKASNKKKQTEGGGPGDRARYIQAAMPQGEMMYREEKNRDYCRCVRASGVAIRPTSESKS